MELEKVVDYNDSKIEEEHCAICDCTLSEFNRTFSINDFNKIICVKCQMKESYELLTKSKKVKIKIFNTHFAWIHEYLLNTFDRKTGIKNRTEWIFTCARADFDFFFKSKEDIERFDIVVRLNNYLDKTDWLREKMRLAIKNVEGNQP